MGTSNQVIKILSGEKFTPYTLARKLSAKALLESASYAEGRSRYSLLLLDEAFRVSQEGGKVIFRQEGFPDKELQVEKDILDALRYFADQHTAPFQDFPFPAGGLGFLSYEFCRRCDTIALKEREDPLGLPEGLFIFGHQILVFDHYTDLLYLIGLNYREHEIDLSEALEKTEKRIADLDFTYLQDEKAVLAEFPPVSREGYDLFCEGVEKIRKEIIAGNLLQGVLSRRISVKSTLSGLEAYRRLRTVNPAPYLFYLDFTRFQLFGASPEVHVKAKQHEAVLRPIAGTRRRGKDLLQDRALEKELREDEKEQAEHLMLVDLARNDLGRVCTPGTVKMREFMEVERYAKVMHLVSEVSGEPAEGVSGADIIRASFPAGTVSGAPKIRAIETIDALEPHRRGFYAGLVGYMEPGAYLDTCITIRSALKMDDTFYLQAGAGIVYDSDPQREFEETEAKLSALVHAMEKEN
ncbi:MAG: chorismate-binding protein [Spirochaetaceae bacterium]